MIRLLTLLALLPFQADAACRQALALGLDVSGSVDAREYRLQLDGLAAALEHPEVISALFALPDAPVRLAVYEWSGPQAQRLIQDWVEISDAATLAKLTARLRSTRRKLQDPSTALGTAKAYGAALLADQTQCWQRVLDISGDGGSNTGPRPQDLRPAGITINGLVIGDTAPTEDSGLAGYFTAYVIEGVQSFVEKAPNFEAFEQAMVRKLTRELTVLVLSRR